MEVSLVQAKNVANLQNLGVDPKYLKFNITAIQSEKFISIKDKDNNGNSQLTIIDQQKGFEIIRKPGQKAEGLLIHLSQNIIALKAPNQSLGKGHFVQIINLSTKKKLKHIEFNQNVVYWKWLNNSTLAMITNSSIYHVDIFKQENQVKITDRDGPLKEPNPVQIIGYSATQQLNWCALNGISTPDGGKTINGHIQLYLIQGKKQQILQGYSCTFGKVLIHNDIDRSSVFSFVQRKQGENTMKVHFNQISPTPQGYQKHKKNCELVLQQGNDFPIYMQICQRYGLVIVLSKLGTVLVYQVSNSVEIWRGKIAQETIFVACKNRKTDGMLAIGKSGTVFSLNIRQNYIAPYIIQNCKFIPKVEEVAFNLAIKHKLPGVDKMFVQVFNKQLLSNDYQGAAKTASSAPGNLLRNMDTIKRLKQLPQIPGQTQPLLIYFQQLMKKGSLNKVQTMQLCFPVINQGKTDIFRGWFQANKLQPCQQLGDAIRRLDKNLALKIYQKCQCKNKVVQLLMQMGQTDMAMKFSKQNNINMDYMSALKNILDTNPDSALNYAKNIYNMDKSINTHQIAELFHQKNRLQDLTGFCVQCMKSNRPEDRNWQTRVLEVNIMGAPQVAEAIFQMSQWTQYDRQAIAQLCQQKGLYQRALQNYSQSKDIKRILCNAPMFNQQFLTDYFNHMPTQLALQCLSAMIKNNKQQNMNLCVSVCMANVNRFGVEGGVKVFQQGNAWDGLYYFLGSVDKGTDQNLHYKLIESAAKCGNMKAVQQIIKTKPDCYNAQKVKNLLIDLRLQDPKPLIYLCDIHNQVDQLVKYLYKNNQTKFIEIYLLRVSQKNAPIVLGTLIDMECQESWLKQLLNNLKSNCPMQEVIKEFDKRNRLRVLQHWLQARANQGIQLMQLHNALGKLKVYTNQNPQQFLTNNPYYDSKVVGKFCQDHDPHLAVIAYRRAWGQCDQQFIMVTNNNSLFRLQAKYLVQRQNKDLWKSVLAPDNPYRKNIVDQVITTALPQSKNIQQVSITVQAFLSAQLSIQLISLLQKIVLHTSQFSKIKKLQNLLIITAIKSDKSRVMEYINRLDNYDGPEIAKIAIGQNYQLYQEAFVIYKKQNMNIEAISILLDYLNNLQKAAQFAQKINLPQVWSKLANAYLDKFLVTQAINCYIKAKNPNQFMAVINSAQQQGKFDILIKYLLMARSLTKDTQIDNALSYAYAVEDKLADLENFIANPNSADIQKVGDRCFADKRYQAAKILFSSIKNNAKIAACYIALKQYSTAIQAAKKANTPKTWKQLCMTCVQAEQYKLANIAGLNIIIHPDHLQDLIQHYQAHGVSDQMINLLQTGMGLQKAHVGIFTELGILYAQYDPQRLKQHAKAYFNKINVPKLLRSCQKYHLWAQAVYLYTNYNQFDNAINIMIEHSPSSFNHQQFVVLLQKVTNNDYFYKAIQFYIQQQPMQLNDLLKSVMNKIDSVRAVKTMKKLGYLPLILPFLQTVQNINAREVNQALNQVLYQNGDYEGLRQSIQSYDNFDILGLANLTKNDELLEFRRISSILFRKVGKFELSIDLSKNDLMYRDAIQTAQQSGSLQLIEDLLKFFVQKRQKEFVTFIKPDIVLQYGWRFNLHDYTMPYIINMMRQVNNQRKTQQKQVKQEKTDYMDNINNMMTNMGMHSIMPDMSGSMMDNSGMGGMGMAPNPIYSTMPTGSSAFSQGGGGQYSGWQ